MPFVGGESRLDVIQEGRVASSFRTAAPIDGDWGYFANGEICMIQSSHQDIAWMDTPDYCRRDRIEKIIKPALEIMDKDPAFMFEMEQTLNLMEFLEACPGRKDEVVRRYREGRFFWGGGRRSTSRTRVSPRVSSLRGRRISAGSGSRTTCQDATSIPQ